MGIVLIGSRVGFEEGLHPLHGVPRLARKRLLLIVGIDRTLVDDFVCAIISDRNGLLIVGQVDGDLLAAVEPGEGMLALVQKRVGGNGLF